METLESAVEEIERLTAERDAALAKARPGLGFGGIQPWRGHSTATPALAPVLTLVLAPSTSWGPSLTWHGTSWGPSFRQR